MFFDYLDALVALSPKFGVQILSRFSYQESFINFLCSVLETNLSGSMLWFGSSGDLWKVEIVYKDFTRYVVSKWFQLEFLTCFLICFSKATRYQIGNAELAERFRFDKIRFPDYEDIQPRPSNQTRSSFLNYNFLQIRKPSRNEFECFAIHRQPWVEF